MDPERRPRGAQGRYVPKAVDIEERQEDKDALSTHSPTEQELWSQATATEKVEGAVEQTPSLSRQLWGNLTRSPEGHASTSSDRHGQSPIQRRDAAKSEEFDSTNGAGGEGQHNKADTHERNVEWTEKIDRGPRSTRTESEEKEERKDEEKIFEEEQEI